jgi:hypothetical protein
VRQGWQACGPRVAPFSATLELAVRCVGPTALLLKPKCDRLHCRRAPLRSHRRSARVTHIARPARRGGGSFAPSLFAALLLGAGTALVYPTLLAAVSDASQPRVRARVVGVYRFGRDFLVDTQPVSAHPDVAADGRTLGALDMRDWLDAIHAVDERLSETIAAGLYELKHEQHFTVIDSFDDGRECVETVSRWRGTEVPPSLASRLDETRATVTVEQDIRLRLVRRLKPTNT